ncbi:hypothetical protein F5X96DRAFT_640139 [Biscogniauxia mediterranea]|nr:hypothetical protein F5X96DRAFT_640139 [Biscogniauxia mediterranea]
MAVTSHARQTRRLRESSCHRFTTLVPLPGALLGTLPSSQWCQAKFERARPCVDCYVADEGRSAALKLTFDIYTKFFNSLDVSFLITLLTIHPGVLWVLSFSIQATFRVHPFSGYTRASDSKRTWFTRFGEIYYKDLALAVYKESISTNFIFVYFQFFRAIYPRWISMRIASPDRCPT